MKFIQTLIKMFRHNPQWIIDVDQSAAYDNDGNKTTGEPIFHVKRWHKDGLYYDMIGEFKTINEARSFIANYKSFPLDCDKVY